MSADGVFKETKRRKRVLLVPVTLAHLNEILVYSRNAEEAAEQIEQMSLGVQDAPQFNNAAPAAAPSLDPAAIDQLIGNRVANELAKQQSGNDAKIAQLQKQLEETQAELSATKTRGRAGKKKTSKKAARKPPRKTSTDGQPELTEDEQAALDAIMQNEARNAT